MSDFLPQLPATLASNVWIWFLHQLENFPTTCQHLMVPWIEVLLDPPIQLQNKDVFISWFMLKCFNLHSKCFSNVPSLSFIFQSLRIFCNFGKSSLLKENSNKDLKVTISTIGMKKDIAVISLKFKVYQLTFTISFKFHH